MNARLHRVIGSVVVWGALLALPIATWAQAEDEPFKRGLDARADQKWGEMAKAMQQAIAINRTESMRKIQTGIITRRRSSEYFPYYLLGLALKNENDCVGAVNAWEISEDQKTVSTHPEYGPALKQGYKECAARGVLLRDDYHAQIAAADQVYNETLALLARIDRSKFADVWRPEFDSDLERARADLGTVVKILAKARQTRQLADFNESKSTSTRAGNLLRPIETKLNAAMSTRDLIAKYSSEVQRLVSSAETTDRGIDAAKVTLPPDVAASRESARSSLKAARDRIGQAEKALNAPVAAEGVKLAGDANDALTKILDQARKIAQEDSAQKLQLASSGANEQLAFLTTSFATLERRVADNPQMMTPVMTSERDALLKDHAAAQRRLENARRSDSLSGVQDAILQLLDIRKRLDQLIKTFGPPSLRERGVSESLEEGSRRYLAGEFQQAITALEPLKSVTDAPLQIHAHVFRAAALYSLYMRSGETNQAYRTDALAEIQRCKEIDPAFQPSQKYFSPRFLSFFQTGGTRGSGPAATAPSR